MSMRWGQPGAKHSRHKLVLKEFSGGQVKLWNPQGPDDKNAPDEGAPRKLLPQDGPGFVLVREQDFFARLKCYHLAEPKKDKAKLPKLPK